MRTRASFVGFFGRPKRNAWAKYGKVTLWFGWLVGWLVGDLLDLSVWNKKESFAT